MDQLSGGVPEAFHHRRLLWNSSMYSSVESPRSYWRQFSIRNRLRRVSCFVLDGRNIVAGSMEPAVVAPVDPGEGRKLNV